MFFSRGFSRVRCSGIRFNASPSNASSIRSTSFSTKNSSNGGASRRNSLGGKVKNGTFSGGSPFFSSPSTQFAAIPSPLSSQLQKIIGKSIHSSSIMNSPSFGNGVSNGASSATTASTASSQGVDVIAGSTMEAGDNEVERIIHGSKSLTVIVDFYANWCGPCRMLAPILKRVIEGNEKAVLVKVNVDDAQETAAKYQIASLPTVFAFRNGKVVDQFIGFRDEAGVKKFVENNTREFKVQI